jgi:alanyl-tRNA synthetase
MKKLATNELRKAYLDFFVERGHRLVKSDSLVPANDPSLLFTSAGMNQFKDYFLGKVKDFRRATSAQKCFRTGDLDQVGQTPYHHTFFEMLGNFSFRDYFKKEAIAWAWEFVTKVLEVDKKRLWVSVYEDDDEALNIWRSAIGLSPDKIKKFGQKDNFWPSNAIALGPNGPCGPCSEIYYQKEDGSSVEAWNLVFTQFNRCDGGVLEPLPGKNIDTGMGLERMSSVLQGVDSNFKIDIFVPIVATVKRSVELQEENLIYTIADHARAVTFCICDGVLPSNDGRGYVIRKLIRRCLYLAEVSKPFLYKIVSSVTEAMKEPYPELLDRRDNVAGIIKAEEEKYIKNILEGGSERLKEEIELHKKNEEQKSMKLEFPAQKLADLYMTYGIPIENTVEALNKVHISTDSNLAFKIVKIEQDKSKDSSKMATNIFSKEEFVLKTSKFVGYDMDSCKARILQVIKDGKEVDRLEESGAFWVILDKTPFYAESGGQIGDRGEIVSKGGKVKVSDVQKQKDAIVHLVEGISTFSLKVGDEVEAVVDKGHRDAVKRAHTATHILQAVLRRVLGPHVQQAGSYVEPDRFRFDFTHFKEIDPQELKDIQDLLNEYVIKNDSVKARIMPKLEAKKSGAIALFGEKYEDEVRVISIADYSKEFCGGTHLNQTGNIGMILITSESSVGSGLRRIEALCGRLAYNEVEKGRQILQDVAGRFKTKPENLSSVIEEQLRRQKALEKELLNLRENELEVAIEKIAQKTQKIKGVIFVGHTFKNFDANLLRKAVDLLKEKIPQDGVFVVSSVQKDHLYFAAGSTASAVSADALIKNILPLVGGSGGGRKDFAQGGTKEIGKAGLVLAEAEKFLRSRLL